MELVTDNTEKRKITEQDGLQVEWMREAKEMTLEKLPAFLKKLTEDYHHDYGTIVHAVAAAAIAAAWSVERGPSGGITGFQAGCVMWEIINGWGVWGKGPKRVIDYDDLCYPQMEHKFRTISPANWAHAQKLAREKLTQTKTAHPDVIAHWESIAAGQVPFGLVVRDESA